MLSNRFSIVTCTVVLMLLAAPAVASAESVVDPTFLYRHLSDIKEAESDLTTATSHYKPLFGVGDPDAGILRGVARYGQVTIDPGGHTTIVNYPDEEQVYVVLEGSGVVHYGEADANIRKGDFMYLPPGVKHGISNPGTEPCRVIVMGYRIPEGTELTIPEKLQLANVEDVEKQVVGSHPPSTLFQLMMGATTSTRDKIAAGHVLTSLFVMEFAPGGTNIPHHHDAEEEIYLLLDGEGDMVAGGGMDGVEGKHRAKPGDAYFFRLNCTVGFYNDSGENVAPAHILAIRSRYPTRRGR